MKLDISDDPGCWERGHHDGRSRCACLRASGNAHEADGEGPGDGSVRGSTAAATADVADAKLLQERLEVRRVRHEGGRPRVQWVRPARGREEEGHAGAEVAGPEGGT